MMHERFSQRWLAVAGVLGAAAVAMGAFGAHAVPSNLARRGMDELAIQSRLEEFNTAARYHTYGALFLVGVSLVARTAVSRPLRVAAWCMLAGVAIFCGAVYAVALAPDDWRRLFGMLAPVGGSLMIAAWIALALAALAQKE